jgi:hypothetical protein
VRSERRSEMEEAGLVGDEICTGRGTGRSKRQSANTLSKAQCDRWARTGSLDDFEGVDGSRCRTRREEVGSRARTKTAGLTAGTVHRTHRSLSGESGVD